MININMNRAAGARASAKVRLTAAMVRKTEDMVSVAKKENTTKVKNAPGVRRRLAMK